MYLSTKSAKMCFWASVVLKCASLIADSVSCTHFLAAVALRRTRIKSQRNASGFVEA
jgi:hypothetical protein